MTSPKPPDDSLQGKKGTVPICRNGPEGAAHKWGLSPFSPDDSLRALLDAACSDALNDEQFDRLEAALRASEEARRLYLRYCTLEGDLHFLVRMTHADDGTAGDIHPSSLMPHRSDGDSDGAAVELPHQLGELPHQPDGPTPEPLIPPIIIDTSAAPSPPLLATFFAPGGWAFSYAAATVVTGLLLLVLWAWTVSHEREFAGLPPHSTPPAEGTEKPSELVGRIIGTADCRWANPGDIPPAAIRVGRKYELAAGLLEISYDSGAKVILQGPCTYEVDSPAGGFLSLGKLTARLEKKGEGGRGKAEEDESPKSESRNPKSPFPPPPSPFVVRTPTATVTDLGTEFGVEVGKEGQTEARVFKGAVLVTAAASQGAEIGQSICREGEAVRVSGGEPVVRAIPRQKNNTAPAFVRAMPPPQSVRESRAYAELVLSLKPAVYYRMDRPENDKGRQLVLDSAPGGHHGELRLADPSGSPYVSGRFGDALWFCGPDNDRMSDRVLVFDYPKAANDRLTVSAWVMAVGRPEWAMIASNWGIPIGEHANTGQFQLCLYRDDGDLAACVTQRDGQRVEVREGRDSPLPLRVWQHVALVADGTTLRLYRNGKEVASGPCAGVLPDPPLASLGIGCRTNKANTDAHPAVGQYAWFWRGGIDEVAVFNRALSPETIEHLYSGNSSPDHEANQALKKGVVPMNGP